MADRDKQDMGVKTKLTGNGGGPYSLTYGGQNTGIVTGTGADWFGPLNPMPPVAPEDVKGRILDFPSGYNLNIRPRSYEAVTFDMLRAFADSYDLLRILIETRKDQMARLEWNIVPRDKKLREKGAVIPGDVETRITEIMEFFLMPDKENFWDEWLRMLLEDLFVIDAPTLYRRKTIGGELYALQPLDGGTIKRIIDDFGNTPEAPVPAYQQVLKGYPAVDYTTEELIYRPRVRRTHKIYGYSPVEQIVMTINIGLRRQSWQLQSFTEGNIPEALIGTPATWTPDQVRQFQEWFDSMLQGNTGERRRARFVPGDVAKGYIPTKPSELFGAAEEWLVRVMCYAFNVSPQPFVNMMNRATAETAQETAVSEGLAPIQNWVKGLMNLILIQDFNSPDLEFKWLEEEELDPNIKSQIIDREQAAGRLTFNEARKEQGLDPVEHPDADRPMFKTASGYVPIFLTPEEQAAKDAAAQAMQDALGAGGEEGAEEDTGEGDGPGGPPPPGNPPRVPPADEEEVSKGDKGVLQKGDHPFGCCGHNLEKVGKATGSEPYPHPLRPSVNKIEKRLARRLKSMLKEAGSSVSKQIKDKLDEVVKAEYPEDFDIDELLASLDLDVFALSQDEIEDAIDRVLRDSGKIALSQMGVAVASEQIVERVNQRALSWASERAAELVNFGDDEDPLLIEATREMLRSTIASGIENNLSTSEIGDLIEENYAFSEDRAQLIAATEITSANSMGALMSYEEAAAEGVKVKKSWLILEDACDICQENADAGPIDLDEEFPSGDMAPGAHPNCRCVLIPEVEDEEGNTSEGEPEEGDDDVEKMIKAEWNEEDHPRAENGQFEGGGGASSVSENQQTSSPRWDGTTGEAGRYMEELHQKRDEALAAGDKAKADIYQGHIDSRVEAHEMAKEFDQKFEGPELTKDQQGALNTYTSNAYKKINEGLRNDNPPASREKMISRMDAAIAGERLKEDVTLYRGIKGSKDDVWEVGQTISDKGFQSTSYSKDEAVSFATRQSHYNTLFEITNTKGMNALNVNPNRYPTASFAHEVVLSRNQGFVVTGTRVEEHKSWSSGKMNKVTVVTMEPVNVRGK